MAITPTSSTNAASIHGQQQSSAATPKPKSADFSKALASASAPPPAPPAAPKQVNSTATNLQSGDGTKATA